ncbi:DUF5331 domain-containing protein [Mastigocladopsis repens]|uniref:DUF5331 domain-containing protein n=1 Tax=Mastigocladopsis repens TaxID=221287 RepID=UPI00031AEC68|nr:DUF5331 domain-containing protein [Mastigocladopsis repens]
MAFFHSFTESIKQKWLQFFQVNRDWITLHMEVESVYTPDGGRRPPSYLILGVVNALEPKLAQLMLPFSKLNPDADTLVEVLELNFDPDVVLGNRVLPKVDMEKQRESDVIDENFHDETLTNSQINGFGQEAIAHELDMGDTDEETLMGLNPMMDDVTGANEFKVTQNGVGNSSFNDKNLNNLSHQADDSVDEFGDISFDDLKEVDSKTSVATTSDDENEFRVVDDVWGDETASQKGEADNEMFLGEELSSGSFDEDESEIASLFPKT